MRLRQRCGACPGKSRADKNLTWILKFFVKIFMFLISLHGTPFFLHFLTPVKKCISIMS